MGRSHLARRRRASISPRKFPGETEFFVIEQSERATHVSGIAEEAYKASDRGSSVTEDHIGSAVYMLDTTDSAGGTSDTQLFDEAPHPRAPRDCRDVDAGRESEEIAHRLLSTRHQESRIHEGAASSATPMSEGESDERSGDDSLSGTNDAPPPPSLIDYGDFRRLYSRMETSPLDTPRHQKEEDSAPHTHYRAFTLDCRKPNLRFRPPMAHSRWRELATSRYLPLPRTDNPR